MPRFTEIIDASVEWTVTVLFRPFQPKKWLLLGFVALLAGYLGGSSSFNSSSTAREKDKPNEAQKVLQSYTFNATKQEIEAHSSTSLRETLKTYTTWIKNPANITVVSIIVILIVSIVLLLMWLNARFAFVFLEDVIKNDASIKMPFKANKELGNSLFLFFLVWALIFLSSIGSLVFMCIRTLINMGAFNKQVSLGFKAIFLTCLPYGLLFLLIILFATIFYTLNNDFVLAVMFKDKIRIMQAWLKILAMVKQNTVDFIKYLFIKMGLAICSAILTSLISLAASIGLLLPCGILALLFYVIYLVLPQILHIPYFIILAIILTPVALFLFYCLMCLNLPFAVFFRTLSIKFIGRLDQRYNLSRYATG